MARQSASAKDLIDGLIRVSVQSLDGSKRQIEVDVLILKMCCEEAETAHNYKPGSPPTSVFLRDLSQRLQAVGVTACTPSVAYQLWHLSGEMITTLKKNMPETPSLPSGSTSNRKAKGKTAK